jgi:hypothetical protein
MKKMMLSMLVLFLASIPTLIFAQDRNVFGGLYFLHDTKEVIMIQCDPKDGYISKVYHSQKGGKFVRYEIMRQEEVKDNKTNTTQKILRLYHEKAPNVAYDMKISTRGFGDCNMQFNTVRQTNVRTLARLATEENTAFDPADTPQGALSVAISHLTVQYYDLETNTYTTSVDVAMGLLEDPRFFEITLAAQGDATSFMCGFEKDLTLTIGTPEVERSKRALFGKLTMLSNQRWCLSIYDASGKLFVSFAQPE